MGFSVGRFAKIWKLEDKTTYTPVSDLSEADLKGKQIVNLHLLFFFFKCYNCYY